MFSQIDPELLQLRTSTTVKKVYTNRTIEAKHMDLLLRFAKYLEEVTNFSFVSQLLPLFGQQQSLQILLEGNNAAQ